MTAVGGQIPMFEAGPGGSTVVPKTTARGPKGLLMALVEMGLPEDAYEAAAALVLELDAGATRQP